MIDTVFPHLSAFHIGLFGFPLMLILVALRIPLAGAMFVVGLLGTYIIAGDMRMMNNQLKTFTYGTLMNYSLSIIPLFLLMSEFAARSGMSSALFNTAQTWLGHRKGGAAMATIGACAGFGAVCGSSLATVSSMGKVALPELRKAGYSDGLTTGVLAAGGTLGILIPPSIVLVIYAILAEENIEKLFIAAFIPALLAMAGYMIAIAVYVRLVPQSAKVMARASYRQRFAAVFAVWPVLIIFVLVIGGIYTGAFSPTSAAAVGVAGTGILAFFRKALSWQSLKEALLATAQNSAMIFFIILAAGVFNAFLSSAQVPQTLAQYFANSALSPWWVLIFMLLFYIVLGTVMDSLAMIFLTVPIFVPIITHFDFGIAAHEVGIWFGVLVLMSVEIGLITPPVGLNLFVINALARNVPISQTYRGVLPFIVSDLIRIALLVAFPTLTLSAVRVMYGS